MLSHDFLDYASGQAHGGLTLEVCPDPVASCGPVPACPPATHPIRSGLAANLGLRFVPGYLREPVSGGEGEAINVLGVYLLMGLMSVVPIGLRHAVSDPAWIIETCRPRTVDAFTLSQGIAPDRLWTHPRGVLPYRVLSPVPCGRGSPGFRGAPKLICWYHCSVIKRSHRLAWCNLPASYVGCLSGCPGLAPGWTAFFGLQPVFCYVSGRVGERG